MRCKAIRVLVVDDSAVIRKLMTHMLQTDPGIEVIATAVDAFDARQKLIALKPDVVTLDVEMPGVDGLTLLSRIMEHCPVPTVIISSRTVPQAPMTLRALELGAFAVMAKPQINSAEDLEREAKPIIAAVREASAANLAALRQSQAHPSAVIPTPATASLAAAAVAAAAGGPALNSLTRAAPFMIAIGASTGGTEALKALLADLPRQIPPLLIVQHMPPVFTRAFAERLNQLLPFTVKEASDGDELRENLALLAPGDFHMRVVSQANGRMRVALNQEPSLHGVRPAIDILMHSVAKVGGRDAIGVILTGMGKDGAAGLLAMRSAGAHTLAQDEASSVVYGMPKAAFEAGAVKKVAPLNKLGLEIMTELRLRGLS